MDNNFKKKAVKTTILLMAMSFIARSVGFIREILIGSVLGTTYFSDAYNVAISIPNLLLNGALGAVATTFVPLYIATREQGGTQKSMHFTNNMLVLASIVGTFVSIIGIVFARPIISVIAFGFDDITMDLTVKIGRIVFFMAFFLAVNSIFTEYLNANSKPVLLVAFTIPSSIAIILALFFYDQVGIYGLAYATLIGMFLQTVCLSINAAFAGFRLKPVINIKDKTICNMLFLSIPVFLGSSVTQINTTVDRMLASSLTEGSISALNYAFKLILFVSTIIVSSICTIIYPSLSKFAATMDDKSFKNFFTKSINVIIILLLPISVATCLLSPRIIRMLFERGEFNAESTALTASALSFYALGFLFFGCRDIIARSFYALKDTKTPMLNSVITLVVNIILNLTLIRYMAHNGLALATSISAAFSTLLLSLSLHKKIGSIGGQKIAITFVKSVAAATVMCFAVFFVQQMLITILKGEGTLIQIVIFALLVFMGTLVYTVIMYLLKTEELKWIMTQIFSFLKHKF